MRFIYSCPVDSQTIHVLKAVSGYSHAKLTAGDGIFVDKTMDSFRQAASLVRQNPHDFQSHLDNLKARILDNTDDPRILKQINELWPNMQGKEVILIAWMLTDTTIGRGLPAVNASLAAVLLEPLADDTDEGDDATDETWQECIRHLIFDMDAGRSKERLWDELNCYARPAKPIGNDTIKAGGNIQNFSQDAHQYRHSADFTSVSWYGKSYQFTKTQALCVKLLWEQCEKDCPSLSEKTIGEAIGSESEAYRLIQTFRKDGKPHPSWGIMIHKAGKGMYKLSKPVQKNL
jgi:hypothetical protein